MCYTFVLPDLETWHGCHWAWVNLSSSKPQVLGILWAFSCALWLSREYVTVCFSCFLTSLPLLPMLLFSLKLFKSLLGESQLSSNPISLTWVLQRQWKLLWEELTMFPWPSSLACSRREVLEWQLSGACPLYAAVPVLYLSSPYCGTSLGLTLAPSGSALCLGWSFSSCSESSSPLICLQTYLDPGVRGSSP